jgi:hypothetical protein
MQQRWLLENRDVAQTAICLDYCGGPTSPKRWQPMGSVETVKVRVQSTGSCDRLKASIAQASGQWGHKKAKRCSDAGNK